MSSRRPEEVHIPLPTHRRHASGNQTSKEVDLESGSQNACSSETNSREVNSRIIASGLSPISWFKKLRSLFKTSTERDLILDDYKKGYTKFKYDSYTNYPQGWASTASFQSSSDNFAIFRGFSYVHTRLLVNLEADITILEESLAILDNEDGIASTKESAQRLRGRRFDEDGNVIHNGKTPQDDILAQIQAKLLVYDELFLRFSQMKALGQAPEEDHLSVFHWIWAQKPVFDGEYNWIYHPEDFISLIPSTKNRFEDFLWRNATSKLGQFLKSLLQSNREIKKSGSAAVDYFNPGKIGTLAKIAVVFCTVLVLYIPVMLFMMTSMTRISMAGVVLVSVFMFSIMMSVQKKIQVQEIFVGTATYCAFLVTFLGNIADGNGSGPKAGPSSVRF